MVTREAEALPARFRGCVMCALVAGHPSDREVLAERPGAIAVLGRLVVRRGHVLVVLRRHVESIGAMPWSEYADVQRLAWEAACTLERGLRPRRVFVAALGSATQLPMSFPHHHVHVLPLFDGGEADRPSEVLTWRHGVSLYDGDEARELADTLRRDWGGAAASP